jgi:hypothetical protein
MVSNGDTILVKYISEVPQLHIKTTTNLYDTAYEQKGIKWCQ